MRESWRVPIVLGWPGPTACDPIGRVFQRFSRGPTDSVALLFETAVPLDRGGAGSRRL